MRTWCSTLFVIPVPANAQPVQQPQQDAPLILDPGAPAGQKPAPPPSSRPKAQQPQPDNKPNVVIVGPEVVEILAERAAELEEPLEGAEPVVQ